MVDPKNKPPGVGADLLKARDEFLQIMKKGAEFTEELLKENESLRYRVAELEMRGQAIAGDNALVRELAAKVQRLEEERDGVGERFDKIAAESRDYAERYHEIEAAHNDLLNVYVASHQLHSTSDFDEALRTIGEIVVNFIGAEKYAIALVNHADQKLQPLLTEGVDDAGVANISIDSGVVGKVLQEGDTYTAEEFGSSQNDELAACVPLKIKDKTIGVMLFWHFLPHKAEWANVDRELFDLLAGHAAPALVAAKLYPEVGERLDTLQGVIDLMTSA